MYAFDGARENTLFSLPDEFSNREKPQMDQEKDERATAAEKAKALSSELTELSRQQTEALQNATYFNMSKEEAENYDRRHTRISEIYAPSWQNSNQNDGIGFA